MQPTTFDHFIFFDSEFTSLQQQSSLISIALVADTGDEFYAEFTDYDQHQVNDWVAEHVISNLFLDERNMQPDNLQKMYIKGDGAEIKSSLVKWLGQFGDKENSIQLWGDCPPWDWVLFCELFGGAFGIPSSIHYMPMDLATLFNLKTGNPDTKRKKFIDDSLKHLNLKQHNALFDAHMIKACYEKLSQ